MQQIIIVFAIACLAGMGCTAIARRLAVRLDFVDHPDGRRKIHLRPMPLGGGISIFVTTLLVLGGLALFQHPWWSELMLQLPKMSGLLAGGTLIVLVGAVDDARGMRGRQKLCGQLLAAAAVIAGGTLIERVQLFEWVFELGWLAIPLTLFWLLGAINALNLLDGIDGLTTSLGIILTISIAAMASVGNHFEVVILGVIFVGAQFGFLRYNFPPASIYLGDAGSQLIGLVVGALAIQASLKGPGTVLLAAPMAALTIPIFDSVAAILRRKLSGRSLYTTDRGHLHHLLTARVGSRQALMLISLACAVMAAAALFSAYLRNDFVALISVFALVAVFTTTRVFGHSELLLLVAHLRRFGQSLLDVDGKQTSPPHVSMVHIQGSRQWQLLWETLTDWAGELSLRTICLDVNLPTLHEGYHATWSASGRTEPDRRWQLRLPLLVHDKAVGYLDIVGDRDSGTATQNLERLLDLLEPFENQLTEIASDPEIPILKEPETETPPPAAASVPVPKSPPRSRRAQKIPHKNSESLRQ